jgi:hypothetical protein
VECRTTDLEAELQRVVRLAGGLGGSASSWNDGKSVRIVANVPRTAEALFRESVSRGVYDLKSAGDSGGGYGLGRHSHTRSRVDCSRKTPTPEGIPAGSPS